MAQTLQLEIPAFLDVVTTAGMLHVERKQLSDELLERQRLGITTIITLSYQLEDEQLGRLIIQWSGMMVPWLTTRFPPKLDRDQLA